MATFGLVLAVVGTVTFVSGPDPQPTAASVADLSILPEAAPSTLSVACATSGITVSGGAVAATSTGVQVSLSSTMPKGSYLNFSWTGGGGGDPLPASPATWTLAAPPGQLTLSCTLNGDPKPGAERTVTVTDPGAFWSSTTLPDLGCAQAGILDWGDTSGSGATPDEAVNALLPRLSSGGRTLTVAKASIGYLGASTQKWIAFTADGRPYMVIGVGPNASTFTAGPDSYCMR